MSEDLPDANQVDCLSIGSWRQAVFSDRGF